MPKLHNQARLNAINRAMAVIEFSPDGTVLDANENFLNVLGYRLDEVKGRHHRLFCDNEFAQSPEYQALWRQLARGESITLARSSARPKRRGALAGSQLQPGVCPGRQDGDRRGQVCLGHH